MLKVHQRLGLLTTIPLAAALFSSAGAPCNRNCSNTAGADFHAALGSVSVGMYAATAYSSMLSYHISHRLHEVDGVSHSALGKGVCHAGQCNFLILHRSNPLTPEIAIAIFT